MTLLSRRPALVSRRSALALGGSALLLPSSLRAQAAWPTGPVTFLGVMTAPAPSSLTSQLGRPAGMGLVVVSVQAKSPVDGVLNVDDLLVRLDDQKLINNDQLTALIRSRQDGEEVAVTYVRAGKENTVKVKLAKQEALLEQRPIIKAVTQLSGPDKFAVVQANGNVIVGGNFSPAKSIAMSRFNDDAGNVSQTFNYSDATGAIEINLLDGKKKVTVREPDGTVSFSGPYDTEAERKVAPAAIQTRIAAARRPSSPYVSVRPSSPRSRNVRSSCSPSLRA